MPTRVLVVDDEPKIRDVLRRYLMADGFEVSEAATGEAALEQVQALHPEVVVLDVRLPGRDGFEVLADRATKRLEPQPPSFSAPLTEPTFLSKRHWQRAIPCCTSRWESAVTAALPRSLRSGPGPLSEASTSSRSWVDPAPMVSSEAARFGIEGPILIDSGARVSEAYGMVGVYGHNDRPSHSFALVRVDGTIAWVRHYAEMFVPSDAFFEELDIALGP